MNKSLGVSWSAPSDNGFGHHRLRRAVPQAEQRQHMAHHLDLSHPHRHTTTATITGLTDVRPHQRHRLPSASPGREQPRQRLLVKLRHRHAGRGSRRTRSAHPRCWQRPRWTSPGRCPPTTDRTSPTTTCNTDLHRQRQNLHQQPQMGQLVPPHPRQHRHHRNHRRPHQRHRLPSTGAPKTAKATALGLAQARTYPTWPRAHPARLPHCGERTGGRHLVSTRQNGSDITDYDVQYRTCTANDKTCTNSPKWGSWSPTPTTAPPPPQPSKTSPTAPPTKYG